MRFWSLMRKTLIENLRDWKILSMTLAFAPFFVVLMHFYFGEMTPSYTLAVVNRDVGFKLSDGGTFEAGEELIAALGAVESEDGGSVLSVRSVRDLESAQEALRDRQVDLVVEIPADFSQTLRAHLEGERTEPAIIRSWGDPANAGYLMAAVWSDMTVWEYAAIVTEMEAPIVLDPRTTGGVSSLSDFDLYVPGLLVLALMMLMFTAAATLIREKDKGTLIRLRLSCMTLTEWLASISIVQVVLGVAAVILTWFSAVMLGYQASFPFLAMLAVAAISSLSIIAISVLVAAWLRTIFDLMTVGCFPFFILMFFSGGLFPLPEPHLLTLAGRSVTINDLLPTTHATAALGKIMNHGAGLGDVVWELAWIVGLTLLFFIFGLWLFSRRHLRAV
ncbi:ABC transporter permease [Gemmatimonadota bacterium]